MLNKKFASIRETANVKTEKRSSMASGGGSSVINHHHQQHQQNQRLSQSQSMEMFGAVNYQINNNEMLRSSPSLYDQRTPLNSSSPINNHQAHLRGTMLLKASPHAYVNLLHHQYQNNNNPSPQQHHLQYQNNNTSGSMSFGSPIIHDNSSSPNNNSQQWNSTPSLNSNTASPIGTHYTAAQIYMRPKNQLQPHQQHQQPSNASSPAVSHKKLPPDVPKRLSSSIAGVKKHHNGLSRSSMPWKLLKNF